MMSLVFEGCDTFGYAHGATVRNKQLDRTTQQHDNTVLMKQVVVSRLSDNSAAACDDKAGAFADIAGHVGLYAAEDRFSIV